MADTDVQRPPGRRFRRREETRARLIDAGRALIAEKGVAGLRISEITEQADVALGSFYNYFESKEDLVEAVVSEILAALAESAAEPTSDDQDPAETVSAAIRRFVDLAYQDPSFARLIVHLNHADALFMMATQPAARRALTRGLETGRFRTTDREVALTTIIGGSLALIRAIADGELDTTEGSSVWAEAVLRQLAVPLDEAHAIAHRPA